MGVSSLVRESANTTPKKNEIFFLCSWYLGLTTIKQIFISGFFDNNWFL